MDQLPRLGKRELICLLLFTCNYVVSVWRAFLFLLVLGMGYVILLWHSLSLPYNYLGQAITSLSHTRIQTQAAAVTIEYNIDRKASMTTLCNILVCHELTLLHIC